jgi:hypothetical protein
MVRTMEFIKLLKNPENIDQEQLSYLRSIIDNYPYIQSSRAIYLKGLKKSGSFKFDKELKITAAHTTHRNVLFDYINDIDSSKIDNKNEKETHKTSTNKKSFSEWLSLSNVSPIDRSNENVSKSTDSAMINDFIEKNPKIGSSKTSLDIKNDNLIFNEQETLMTETLAEIYLSQNNFDKAIQSYKILSLKYPEKSGFFADQINKIKKIKIS